MAQTRGTRTRVAPGIYRDDIGYAAVVVVGSGGQRQQREHRFPAATAMLKMRAWQDTTRATLRARVAIAVPHTTGTLRADVSRYLPLVAHMVSAADRARELGHWVAARGNDRTTDLTEADLRQVHQAWAAAPASTQNHRRNALIQLYAALYPTLPNPARRLPHRREAKGDARNMRPEDVRDIFAAMPRSATRARLMVMAATGLPQARLRRVRPEDLDLPAKTMRLEGRRKGAGTAGRVFPLTQAAVEAWTEFLACDAFGAFANLSLSISFRRGITAANRARRAADPKARLIPDAIPYQLRHTFGTEMTKLTDTRIVAELLDCSPETALRYTRGAVDTRMADAVAAADRLAAMVGNPRI